MHDYIRYGRARDQLYHYKVKVREHHESISATHRTPELVNLLEMVESIVDAVCTAHERKQVVAVSLDIYELRPLPGFEDLMSDEENPYRGGTD